MVTSVGHGHRFPRLVACGVLALLALLVAGPAAAQQGASIVIRSLTLDPDGTTTLAMSLPPGVTVEQLATDLTLQENAQVIEDYQLQELAVDGQDAGAVAALVLDTSGSTSENGALDSAKQAGRGFVRDVAGREIPVTLVAFSDEPTVLVEGSTDVAELLAAIDALEPAGNTALYDAVVAASGSLAVDVTARQRNLVIFTDGGDTASLNSLGQALLVAQGDDVIITAVSLQTEESDPEALAALARDTEGSVLSVADVDDLTQALGDVATSITSQVLLTWKSDNFSDAEITVSATLATEDGFLTDQRSARNIRLAVVDQPPPRALAPSSPRVLAGTPALVLGLFSGAAATVLLVSVLVAAPARARGAKVLRRQLEPERAERRQVNFDEARVKDAVASVMEALPKPSGYDAKLQLQLDQAAWPLRSGEFLAMSVGLAVAGFLVGALGAPGQGSNIVIGLGLAVGGFMVPRLVLTQRRNKRTALFHDQLPDTLQMLAGSLRAGYGLMQGLENVTAEGNPPAATEFGRVLTETRLGIPLEDALAAMAERVGSEDFRWVTVAVSIQRKVGGNLAELLDTVAATLRGREMVRRQVRVLSAEGRLSAVILVGLPFVFGFYLAATRPQYLEPLFVTGIGQALLAGSAVLLGVGIVWIRNTIRIDV